MRTAITERNAALQVIGDVLDNGFARFYDGSVPLDPNTGLGAQVLVVECALSSPAMGPPSGGQRAFNAIASAIVLASGTPSFVRFFRSDGTTAVVDMDVPDELVLSKPDWTLGELFSGPSVTWNMPVEC